MGPSHHIALYYWLLLIAAQEMLEREAPIAASCT
jgi:hypothetical protein